MNANAKLTEIRENHGKAIANRTVKAHNNAHKNGETPESLRKLAEGNIDDQGAIAFRLAAELLEMTSK